ncbi:MAG: beta-lactamase family protein [Ruminococcaceae bacterium]|nr:beta-lactamase family protein [Oscillospiraceae bacterium]
MRLLDKKHLAELLEARYAEDAAEAKVGGVAVRICQKGEVVYENYFGTVSPDSTVPLHSDIIFRLASMTKPITGVAIMILVDRGLISIEDTVETYFPEFANRTVAVTDENGKVVGKKASKEPLRIKHLLSHTSGLGSGVLLEQAHGNMTAADDQTLATALAYYATLDLSFEPFTSQAYSPTMAFDIAAAIVEKVSGLPYDEFLRKELFDPCEMKDASFAPTKEQFSRFIGMHNRVDEKSVREPMPEGKVFGGTPVTHFLGGAGLAATLRDYSNFAEMLVNGGIFHGKRILSEQAVATLSAPIVPPEVMGGETSRWGLGVLVTATDGHPRLPKGAYGWSGAYGTHFWVDPANKVTAVFMKNSFYEGGAGARTENNFQADVNAAFAEA